MASMISIRSRRLHKDDMLFLTIPSRLSAEQAAAARQNIVAQLPPGVRVVILPDNIKIELPDVPPVLMDALFFFGMLTVAAGCYLIFGLGIALIVFGLMLAMLAVFWTLQSNRVDHTAPTVES